MENKKPVGAVYITTCLVNGKKYIGKFLYSRINSWEKYLGSGTYLKQDIKKYGKENFKKEIVQGYYTKEELEKAEEELILKTNAVYDDSYYNVKLSSVGGDIFTTNPRKEEIRQMRREQMGGKGNHQYGKKKTDKMINSVKKANSRAIEIDGIEYPSTSKASDTLGIGKTTIGYRLDSENYPNYKRLTPRKTKKK
ncbi:GIY-YIG homing endonuclease [Staphylococcus phage vB_SepM_ phiIPLA-C1C]|uniref:GIY-YIG homing endonuclease n=1 Tax=Staphylococcus phage vB_SepM_ phiIPLA-C1C TaxID=1572704 RepID=A0A0D3MV88_9CAUD|nr:homing endonuclease [Staphylococcus phage phiIPLA-C1C]AJA42236.1 GIY-YIG homing endonuclease [Staphylococcus phage phiIPLA-C1C]